MKFITILETLFIGPPKLVFETIFSFAYTITNDALISVVLLSLAINVLVLPLYMRADIMQKKAADRAAELAPGVKHIKKTFKGDEKMMMLQTYYKQNHYSIFHSLNGTVSLLLEIPFFIAAFQFLSNVAIFQGLAQWPFTNLGAPDAIFKIGNFNVNILPILMTVINVVASFLYLKGAPLKTKLVQYALAIFFLVFLYNSPSGLVFYWTLNNLFSLVKNVFYKLKNPKTVLVYVLSITSIVIFALTLILGFGTMGLHILCAVLVILMQIPLAVYWLKRLLKDKIKIVKKEREYHPNKKLFFTSCFLLALLVGVLVPAIYISASPLEFVNADYVVNPLWFIMSSACYGIGTFVIWFGIFYWIVSPKGKVIFEKIACIACVVMAVNFMAFGRSLGNISSALQYDNGMSFSILEILLNVLSLVVIAVAIFFAIKYIKKAVVFVLAVAVAAVGCLSTINMVQASNGLGDLDSIVTVDDELPYFELSKTGQNVVVIMLDRAIGAYVPYIMNELPELKNQFSGFTYYSNTISYGLYTNLGTPSLLGGYDYTPVEMNKRDDVSLAEKQNEANFLMPRVFTEQWDNCDKAYVFDPIYLNYEWISDVTLFEEFQEIQAQNIAGKFVDKTQKEYTVKLNYRNFFCFSLVKCLPVFMQSIFYQGGQYNRVETSSASQYYTVQVRDGASNATGINALFMENYNHLINLNTMTKTTDSNVNRYVFMTNDITHNPMLVDEANGYVPSFEVDNTAYDQQHSDRFTVDGSVFGLTGNVKMDVSTYEQMSHYQTNVVALMQLGKWFEYLKAEGLYDNTRIIIVSDHGQSLGQFEQLIDGDVDLEGFMSLLLFKDFNSQGSISYSQDFMTTADVPALATQGIIGNATNPYTSTTIDCSAKSSHSQYLSLSTDWSIIFNNGNTFNASKWASVKDNVWKIDNWDFSDHGLVLKEHAFPNT